MIQNKELHDRIMAFDIDGGPSDFTFAMKLAKQQKWSREYTERVIAEYRRFLYLGAVEGPVSPSPQVDEVWHLHLTYTVSYWERLCGEVLAKPFHHNPSRGKNETTRYSELSETTLEKYARTFGEKPPSDIWRAVTRSAPSESWVIPKAKAKRIASLASLSAIFGLIAAGCASSSSETSLLPFFVVGLLFFGVVVVIIVSIAASAKRDQPGRNGGTGTTGFYGCGTHTGGTHHGSSGTHTNADGSPSGGGSSNADGSTDGGGQSAVSDGGGHSSGSDGGSSGGDGSSGCGGGGGGD